MPEERTEERTLPPTPRKIEEARRRGYVARSIDLSSAMILLAAVVLLNLFASDLLKGLSSIYTYFFSNLHEIDINKDTIGYYLTTISYICILTITPIFVGIFVVALAINLFQVGFLFTFVPLEPNLERLNPVAGLQRIFSLRSLVRLGLDILKVALLGVVVFKTLWDERVALAVLHEREIAEIVAYMARIIFLMSIRAAIVLLIIGFIDYGYTRYRYALDLMMSRTEYMEELRRYEGDPKIRERRRAVQRQLALQRMYLQVPRATVTITNPVEIAVCLRYEETMPAPMCVAKGTGEVARRIVSISIKHGIPVVQKPPLARALYKMVEVGQYIPEKLYVAVAEVIRYVMELKKTKI